MIGSQTSEGPGMAELGAVAILEMGILGSADPNKPEETKVYFRDPSHSKLRRFDWSKPLAVWPTNPRPSLRHSPIPFESAGAITKCTLGCRREQIVHRK
jgi:hypothetical protein